MKKMSEKKIVRRSQINLENAGYTYSYCICNRQEIKSTIKEIVDSWTKKFHSEIERW